MSDQEHPTTPSLTPVTVPGATVDVLDKPYTAAQYATLPDIGERGEITRNVSLDIQRMVESDYDSIIDTIAETVVCELGEEWQLHSYRLLGLDPRQAGTPDEGCHGIFAVTVNPDVPESGTWSED